MNKTNGARGATGADESMIENDAREDISKLRIPIMHEYGSAMSTGGKRQMSSVDNGALIRKGLRGDEEMDFIDIDDDELVYDVKQAVSPTSSRSLDNPDFGSVNIMLRGDSAGIVDSCRRKEENKTENASLGEVHVGKFSTRKPGEVGVRSELENACSRNVDTADVFKEEKRTFEFEDKSVERGGVSRGEMSIDAKGNCESIINVGDGGNTTFKMDELKEDMVQSQKEFGLNSKFQENAKTFGNEDSVAGTSSVNVCNANKKQQSQIQTHFQLKPQPQNLVNLVALCISTPPPYNGLPQNNPFFSSNGINDHINIVPFSTAPFFYLGFPEESAISNNQSVNGNNSIPGVSNVNTGTGMYRGGMGIGVGIGIGGFGRGSFCGFGGINGIGGVGSVGGNMGVLNSSGNTQRGIGVALGNSNVAQTGNIHTSGAAEMEADAGGNASGLADVNMLSGVNGGSGLSGCRLRPAGNASSELMSHHLLSREYLRGVRARKMLKTGTTLVQLDGYTSVNGEYGGVPSSLNGNYGQQQHGASLFQHNASGPGRHASGKRAGRGYSQTRGRSVSSSAKLNSVCASGGNLGAEDVYADGTDTDYDGSTSLNADKAKPYLKSGSSLNGINDSQNSSSQAAVPEKKSRWQLSDPQFKSGYKGVSWNSRMEAWLAFFVENGIRKSKTFSSRKFGFNRAREKAIRYLDARRKGIILTTPPPLSPSKGVYDRIPQHGKSVTTNTNGTLSSNGDILVGVEGDGLGEVNYRNAVLDANSNAHSSIPNPSYSHSVISNINIGNVGQGVVCTRLN
ncbi:erythrocyte membrane protein PFEMP3 [Cryptosporidium ryanae]|uniref:erythrocyte membrane protein PFEMP3 n=1 Tax=Cryptosporidium ryanae TaxID=515981 RepID=UPI00351A49A1|nr:erythrocyte membrane protein PFEMP3 [Cryptosporidium ryanae]